jgi:hypothetical protein
MELSECLSCKFKKQHNKLIKKIKSYQEILKKIIENVKLEDIDIKK